MLEYQQINNMNESPIKGIIDSNSYNDKDNQTLID